MSTTVLTQLLDKRNKAHADAQEIHKAATVEGRVLTSDEQEKFDRAFEDMEKYDKMIRNQQRIDEVGASMAQFEEPEEVGVRFGAVGGGSQEPPAEKVLTLEERSANYARELEQRLIRSMDKVDHRAIMDAMPKELRVAQNITTAADGGYLVPDEWRNRIVESMKYYGPMLNAGRIFRTTSGAELNMPSSDATSEKGAIIAEDTADAIAKTAIGNVQFGAFMYTSKIIPITIELLQDSAYDVVGLVLRVCASRIGRILNEHLTTGAGTTQPFGVVTKATNSGVTLAQDAITAEKLVDLEHTLDPLYRQGPDTAFMFEDSTLAAIKKLSFGSTDDRPLWLPSIRTGEPDTILGYKYWINNEMAKLSAYDAKAVLFGDFSKYEIREVMGMTLRRSDHFYWSERKVAFNMIARYDANLVDTAAVKYAAVVSDPNT